MTDKVAAKRPTVAEVLAAPERYGFKFQLKDLNKRGVPLRQLPHVYVTDWRKFDESFGCVQAQLNGTSTNVTSDGIGRDFAYENQKMAIVDRDATIRRLNVERLLGIEPQKQTFAGPPPAAGEARRYFATQEEADAAWLQWRERQ